MSSNEQGAAKLNKKQRRKGARANLHSSHETEGQAKQTDSGAMSPCTTDKPEQHHTDYPTSAIATGIEELQLHTKQQVNSGSFPFLE